MRARHVALLAAFVATAAIAACTLNPQPLPPSDFSGRDSADASAAKDSGSFSTDPETPPTADAGATNANDEAGTDGGDASDDGGDAGPDADAG